MTNSYFRDSDAIGKSGMATTKEMGNILQSDEIRESCENIVSATITFAVGMTGVSKELTKEIAKNHKLKTLYITASIASMFFGFKAADYIDKNGMPIGKSDTVSLIVESKQELVEKNMLYIKELNKKALQNIEKEENAWKKSQKKNLLTKNKLKAKTNNSPNQG
ncbi:MAG: hypothetical protein N4A43_04890 [Alphaproteobacteria bacterium]|jgi:hypothetical protein|nr:hypothetical protein [Alphaproteobacteria bacterium]